MKNPILAAVLGFFVFGLFYLGMSKRICLAVLGLVIVSYALTVIASPGIGCVANVIGAYLGYKWAKELNEGKDPEKLEPFEK